MDLSAWAPLFEDAADPHVALVYRDQDFLARAVALWSAPALRGGGGAILVGTAAHGVVIREELRREGIDVERSERDGSLLFVDADWLMGHFILDGTPDASRFRALAGEIVGGMRQRLSSPHAPVRAWGEMVSLLRMRGNPQAALRLEAMWREAILAHDIALLCSYDAAPGASGRLEAASLQRDHGTIFAQPGLSFGEAPKVATR